MLEVPINRITTLNDEQPNMDAPYVLYWMIAFRRVNYNFSLQRAIEWANKLSKPLLIFEPMTIDYPMASIRFHKFAIEGMQDIQKQTEKSLKEEINSTMAAREIAGIPKRKENFAASPLSQPDIKALEIVIPDLDTPGKIANA